MTLDHSAYLTAIRRESDRFLEVLRDHPAERRVPSCPDWDADDLLWHLGEVQWFWGTVVAERLQDVDDLQPPARPDTHEGLVAFFEQQSARLHDSLAAASPDEAVYMWAEDRTVGYVARRQAHEALIHRLDAELTAGDVTPLDPTLASDGVDEALTVMFGGCPPWGTFTPTPGQLLVEATDTGLVLPVVLGRFVGTDPRTGTSYDEELVEVRTDPGASSDATLRGRAEDLDAWLWHRRDRHDLTVEGDPDAFARFEGVLAQPIE
jgi:uncharacterized protein (TIGR03083 family)